MCLKQQGDVLPGCVLRREKQEEQLMLWNALVRHLTQENK